MSFWLSLWTILLIVAVVVFAGLAIVVAVGGYRDLRAMFRSLDEQHAGRTDDDEQRGPSPKNGA